MCQGQQQSAALGYSPMPINLVEDSFTQIEKIPGAVDQNINIQSCDNPTFSTTGVNTLAETAPYPPACDKQGPTQCTTGTGGATAVATPPSPGSPVAAAGGAIVAASTGSSGGSTGSGATGGTSVVAGGGGGAAGGMCVAHSAVCTAAAAAAAAARVAAAKPEAFPDTLAVSTGWSWDQYLMILVALLALAVILIPGWFAAVAAAVVFLPRRISRRSRAGSGPPSAGPPSPTGAPPPPTGGSA